jgi:hypothetical protein
MENLVLYGSLALLFASIIYVVRQFQVLRSKRQGLGDVVYEIFPSKSRRIMVMIAGIAFIVLLIAVTIMYLMNDTPYSYANILVIALACFAGGGFLGRTTILYDKGMIAYMRVIEYGAIKSYEFKEMKRKKNMLLYLHLSNNIGLQVVVSAKDRSALDKIFKKIV